jgi:predicted XRE-type DNA-binding protein
MHTKTTINGIVIEQGSANPYADLNAPDAEAMLVKAELARQIAHIIKHRRLTQQKASAILGMTQPKLSGLLRGQFRGISQAKMIECLNRLGRDVNIVVRKATRQATGHTQVLVA